MNSHSSPVTARGAYKDSDELEHLIQGLYALGLKLEYCINLVEESPEQARDGLDSAITGLGEAIDLLRDHMQGLHQLT